MEGIGSHIVLILVAAAYFAPSLLGVARKVPNIGSVIVVNLFFGWSFVGWVVALAMAARSKQPDGPTVTVQNLQAPNMQSIMAPNSEVVETWNSLTYDSSVPDPAASESPSHHQGPGAA